MVAKGTVEHGAQLLVHRPLGRRLARLALAHGAACGREEVSRRTHADPSRHETTLSHSFDCDSVQKRVTENEKRFQFSDAHFAVIERILKSVHNESFLVLLVRQGTLKPYKYDCFVQIP